MASAKNGFNQAANQTQDQNITRIFFDAISKDDCNLIAQILQRYPYATSWKNEEGLNPLIHAARNRRVNATTVLLNAGVPVDATKANGSTALMFAAAVGCMPIVEKLIDAGCDINHQNVDGTTALIMAAAMGHQYILEYMVEKKADIALSDKDQATAITHAYQQGFKECAAYLEKTLAEREQARLAAKAPPPPPTPEANDNSNAIKSMRDRMKKAKLF